MSLTICHPRVVNINKHLLPKMGKAKLLLGDVAKINFWTTKDTESTSHDGPHMVIIIS